LEDSLKKTLYSIFVACEVQQNKLALLGLRPNWNVGIIPCGFPTWMAPKKLYFQKVVEI
jgi:hypothetical protein